MDSGNEHYRGQYWQPKCPICKCCLEQDELINCNTCEKQWQIQEAQKTIELCQEMILSETEDEMRNNWQLMLNEQLKLLENIK